ncbi:hypothetical protein BC830DRAFT_406037 [Chytriomyces sp. MP71]|nr:hypothetical protein BC830DRAFT_406037 [Chytriomyces sp. MP71]
MEQSGPVALRPISALRGVRPFDHSMILLDSPPSPTCEWHPLSHISPSRGSPVAVLPPLARLSSAAVTGRAHPPSSPAATLEATASMPPVSSSENHFNPGQAVVSEARLMRPTHHSLSPAPAAAASSPQSAGSSANTDLTNKRKKHRKDAEQTRRDQMKECLSEVKRLVPATGGSRKALTKEGAITAAYQYILQLKQEAKSKAQTIKELEEQITAEVLLGMGLSPSQPSD